MTDGLAGIADAASAADPKVQLKQTERKLYAWGELLVDSGERLQFQEKSLYAALFLQILSLIGCAVAVRQLFLKRGSFPQIDNPLTSPEFKAEE